MTEGQNVEIRGKTLPYVSRGGLKLEKAMQLWPIGLHGAVCADIRGLHRRIYRLYAPKRGTEGLCGGRGV